MPRTEVALRPLRPRDRRRRRLPRGRFEQPNEVDLYSPASDTWRSGPTCPPASTTPPRRSSRGSLYVLGGYGAERSAFVLDGARWRTISAAGAARRGRSGGAPRDGLRRRRRRRRRATRARCSRTTRGRGRWRTLPGPTPRQHLAVTAARGRIYAIAGRVTGLNTNFTLVESWAPGERRWRRETPVPAGARRHRRGCGRRERSSRSAARRPAGRFARVYAYDVVGAAGAGLPICRRRATGSASQRCGGSRLRDRRRPAAGALRQRRQRVAAPSARTARDGGASSCVFGRRRRKRGRYQFHSPSSSIDAGSSTARTIVASISTAAARPTPACFTSSDESEPKSEKTRDHHERGARDDAGGDGDAVPDRLVGRHAGVDGFADAAQDEDVVVHREPEEHDEEEQRQPRDDRAVRLEAEQRLGPVCWKTRTSTPYAAPTESRLRTIAFSGTTIERKATSSSRNANASTNAITYGTPCFICRVKSTSSAVAGHGGLDPRDPCRVSRGRALAAGSRSRRRLAALSPAPVSGSSSDAPVPVGAAADRERRVRDSARDGELLEAAAVARSAACPLLRRPGRRRRAPARTCPETRRGRGRASRARARSAGQSVSSLGFATCSRQRRHGEADEERGGQRARE